MSTVVVALVTPVTGRRDDLMEAFRAIIPAVLAEPGCEQYDALLERGGSRIVLVERWRTDADLEAHSDGAALSRLRELGAGTFALQELILLDASGV